METLEPDSYIACAFEEAWLILLLLALPSAADTCETYGLARQEAKVKGSPIRESSGVAESRTRDGVWFTHNDRGDEAQLYAFDLSGQFIETHEVRNADHFDWEDIAAAPCPDRGDCLYIGDIGDNDRTRAGIIVYVVREPEAGRSTRAFQRWSAVYPPADGPQDAEALLVNPCTGRVHVITKDGDGVSNIYRYPPFPGKEVSTLTRVGTIYVDGLTQSGRQVTGGDFDADGDRVVIRTGNKVLEWIVDPDNPNAHWNEPPREIEGAADFQGEGITYALDGTIVTTSEGAPMSIGEVPCESAVPADHDCDFPFQGGCGCNTSPRALWIWPLLALFRRRR